MEIVRIEQVRFVLFFLILAAKGGMGDYNAKCAYKNETSFQSQLNYDNQYHRFAKCEKPENPCNSHKAAWTSAVYALTICLFTAPKYTARCNTYHPVVCKTVTKYTACSFLFWTNASRTACFFLFWADANRTICFFLFWADTKYCFYIKANPRSPK